MRGSRCGGCTGGSATEGQEGRLWQGDEDDVIVDEGAGWRTDEGGGGGSKLLLGGALALIAHPCQNGLLKCFR